MKIAACIVSALCIGGNSGASLAQVPGVIGTWKLNVEASRFPEAVPQVHVRSYRLAENGMLIGLAVFVDSKGRPGFLQFAAKPDGKDYPEFSADSAASQRRRVAPGFGQAAHAPTRLVSDSVTRHDSSDGGELRRELQHDRSGRVA